MQPGTCSPCLLAPGLSAKGRSVCLVCVQLCTGAPSSGLWLRTKEGFGKALISSLCKALQRDLQHSHSSVACSTLPVWLACHAGLIKAP